MFQSRYGLYLKEYLNRMEPKKGGIREFGDLAATILYYVEK